MKPDSPKLREICFPIVIEGNVVYADQEGGHASPHISIGGIDLTVFISERLAEYEDVFKNRLGLDPSSVRERISFRKFVGRYKVTIENID